MSVTKSVSLAEVLQCMAWKMRHGGGIIVLIARHLWTHLSENTKTMRKLSNASVQAGHLKFASVSEVVTSLLRKCS